MTRTNEPPALRRGKAFHRRTQADWKASAEGHITIEKTVVKSSGSPGRIDIHASADSQLVGVVELKASNWDRMTEVALRRNVARHARQVWTYIESQLADNKEVSPGIVYPSTPRMPSRRDLIEALLEEEGISVVWEDETIPQRKARASSSEPSNKRVEPAVGEGRVASRGKDRRGSRAKR